MAEALERRVRPGRAGSLRERGGRPAAGVGERATGGGGRAPCGGGRPGGEARWECDPSSEPSLCAAGGTADVGTVDVDGDGSPAGFAVPAPALVSAGCAEAADPGWPALRVDAPPAACAAGAGVP